MAEQYTAKSLDEMPSREQIGNISGLDYIQAMQRGELPGPTIGETMNFRLHKVEAGRVTFRGAPQFAHLNPQSGVHGGWYGAILDSAMGCAVATSLPKGRGYTTLEYKINLTRAIPIGMEVDCEGWTVHAGRSTAVAEAVIRGVEDGKIYAVGSTTCLVFGG